MAKDNAQATQVNRSIRVRFAPSPTGALHIGGARTAFFNWLYARQQGGRFVLRIDDTDQSRSTEASYQQILESFRWLGMDWDEGPDVGGEYGPYRQSERQDIYRQRLTALVEADKAYPCFCTAEQLQKERDKAQRAGKAPRYSGRCRTLSAHEREVKMASGESFVYRLKASDTGTIIVHDLIRGAVTFAANEVDDFIIWRADGTPTYHFASCVDDTVMKITHIIRAEEHLSNAPRHVALFEALGEGVPAFAHVPMILAPDRSKLSKRHGATSVDEYRQAGILPEALMNYLLLLGFSPGDDNEIVDKEEAIRVFDIERVMTHAAVYDVKKLEWLNAHYVREKPAEAVVSEIWPQLVKRGWVVQSGDSRERLAWIRTIVDAVKQRSKNFDEIVMSMSYYFEEVGVYDEKGVKKHFSRPEAAERLKLAAATLVEAQPFLAPVIEKHYRDLIATWGIKGGDLIHPTRLAITGMTKGPGLFDVMALLGIEVCVQRMHAAATAIENTMTASSQ